MRAALVFLLLSAAIAHAAPPEPTRPHPRLLLDAPLKATWKAQAALERGPVVGAMALCTNAHDTAEHDNAVYMGAEWSKVQQRHASLAQADKPRRWARSRYAILIFAVPRGRQGPPNRCQTPPTCPILFVSPRSVIPAPWR